ncbi:MAG: hypothetical protein D6759_03590 [Chloroflexi bacterium]|nr:MAG: hypothetical protein D6759_03590 [Chloroflexota bacterium]
MKRSNSLVIALVMIAMAAWGLVVWQEVERRRPIPKVIPAGSSIKLPAPKDDRPTEAAPAIEIVGTITDAQTGWPVVADVQAANVFLDDVTGFRLIFPAGEEEIPLTVTAPGYQAWSIRIRPHIAHSKVLVTPVRLRRKPVGDRT